jgi:hypothetical protein
MFRPWQLPQLPVTPVWVMVVLGAGDKKPLLGGRCGALPGTSEDGMLPKWQVSQVVELGMWLLWFAGLVCGIFTMLVMPWKTVTLGPWHSAQLLPMPVWLNNPPPKLVKVVMVLAAVWQDSQPRLRMGTCTGAVVLGAFMPPTVVMVDAYNAAFAVLWHCTQLAVLFWMFA